jgi:cell division protein FtsB
MFVLLATKNAVRSTSVSDEVKSFLRTGRVLTPINFGFSDDPIDCDKVTVYDKSHDEEEMDFERRVIRRAEWYEKIDGLPITDEHLDFLKRNQPSQIVLQRIINSFIYQKQSKRLFGLTIAALVILSILAASIVYSTVSLGRTVKLNAALQSSSDSLKATNQKLTSETDELSEAQRNLKRDLSQLSKDRDELKTSNTLLDERNKGLSSLNQQLLSIQASLNASVSALKKEKNELAYGLQDVNGQQILALAEKYTDADPKQSLALLKYAANNHLISDFEKANKIYTEATKKELSIADGVNSDPNWWNDIQAYKMRSRPVFAADPTIGYVIYQKSLSQRELLMEDLRDGKIVARYQLEPFEEFIPIQPFVTSHIVVGSYYGDARITKIFSLEKGLAKPVFVTGETRDIKFTNGNLPCYALYADGSLKRFDETAAGKIDSIDIAKDVNGYRLDVHPSAMSLCVYNNDSTITWWGWNRPSRSWVKKKLPFSAHSYPEHGYPKDRQYPVIKWGKRPSEILAMECFPAEVGSEPRATSNDRYLAVKISALNAESLIQKVLVNRLVGRNELFYPTMETDDSCANVLYAFRTQRSGTNVFYFKVNWLEDSVAKVSNETLLQDSYSCAETGATVRIAIAPNGESLFISNEWKGTSISEGRKNTLRSWVTSTVINEGQSRPVALEFGVKDKFRILGIGISRDSKKMICYDEQNNFYVFNNKQESKQQTIRPNARPPQILGFASKLWRVNYPNGQVSLFDISTGKEQALNEVLKNEKILDVSSYDSITIIVSQFHLIELSNGKISKNVRLSDSCQSATIGYNTVAVKGKLTLALYDKKTLRYLGATRIGEEEIFKDIKFNGDWYYEDNSYYNYVVDKQNDNGIISAFGFNQSDSTFKIDRWDLTPKIDHSLAITKRWSFVAPDRGNSFFSLRRSPNADVLLAITGNYNSIIQGLKLPDLYQIDLETGKRIVKYKRPKIDFPNVIFEISDFFSVDRSKVCIVFRYVKHNRYEQGDYFAYGIWNIKTGALLKWFDFGKAEQFIRRSKDEFENVRFIKFKLEQPNIVKVVDVLTGKTKFEDSNPNIQPTLENNLENRKQTNYVPAYYIYYDNISVKKSPNTIIRKINTRLNFGEIDWTKLPKLKPLPKEFTDGIERIKTENQ